MKKIIGIILAFTLVLGFFPVFAEETASAGLASDAQNAIQLLSALGIEDFAMQPVDNKVTRQEFAENIYKLVTGTEFPADYAGASIYSDVTDAKYIPYINALAKLKILSGYSDGTFRPDNNVTLNEAFTVIVRALGYDVIAEANGGYPGGYHLTAVNLGISRGVDLSKDVLTSGTLAIIFKNTLLAEIKTKNSYSPDGKIEFSGNTTNLLYSIHKVDVIKDVVNGIDITKLAGESSVPPWNILVGTKLLDIGELEPNHLLGYSVEAYYKYETETLIHIEATKKNSTVVMDVTDIDRIENNEIVRIIDGKNVKISYNALADFIYNNGATEKPLSLSLFDRKNGTLTLIDNNGDKSFDVIKADVYYDVVVDYVSPTERKAYDLGGGDPVSLDSRGSNPYVLLDDGMGGTFTVDSVAKYDVLSVYTTLSDSDQQYVRIIKNSLRASGIVSEIEEDENGTVTVGLGNNKVELTNAAKEDYLSLIKIGETTSILLNAEGKGAGIALFVDGILKYGIIMHCAEVSKDLEKTYFARIYTQQDESQEIYFSDNVVIDGNTYRENDANILKHLLAGAKAAKTVQKSGENRYMQAIRYSLDKEGKFDVIDTVLNSFDKTTGLGVAAGVDDEPDASNSLFLGPSSPNSACEFLYSARAINYGKGILVGTSTVVFGCPGVSEAHISDYTNPENYSYAGSSVSSDDRRFSSYYANPEDITASVIVYHYSAGGGSGSTYSDYFGVFDKVTRGLDKDGGVANKVYYWYHGEYRSDYAADTASFTDTAGKLGEAGKRYKISDLKEGDAVRFNWNNDGKISSFYIYARAEGNIKVGEDQYPTQFRNRYRRVGGFAYKIYENGLGFVQGDDVTALASSPDIQHIRDTVPVIVYDSTQREGHRLAKGSFKSAKSYLKDGNYCSRVYLNSDGGTVYMIYIVR